MKLTNLKTLGKIAITGLIASILPMSVNAKDTVKVGVVSFLTGPAAGPFGTPAKQGAELVIDAINLVTNQAVEQNKLDYLEILFKNKMLTQ